MAIEDLSTNAATIAGIILVFAFIGFICFIRFLIRMVGKLFGKKKSLKFEGLEAQKPLLQSPAQPQYLPPQQPYYSPTQFKPKPQRQNFVDPL